MSTVSRVMHVIFVEGDVAAAFDVRLHNHIVAFVHADQALRTVVTVCGADRQKMVFCVRTTWLLYGA